MLFLMNITQILKNKIWLLDLIQIFKIWFLRFLYIKLDIIPNLKKSILINIQNKLLIEYKCNNKKREYFVQSVNTWKQIYKVKQEKKEGEIYP